ncbi:hypothetical protein IV38_GL000989 [Lactobacillus selangorensis]|uniref:PTS EIIA type-1 domain-containing protein n=1 Tax=Lactobacillus selangorensis TaxID=81857 RepID=A0A0R2FJQ6_9LACO|nr:PTS glucose transporter subunit IIA [Lactobacillus selangorensis]KRN28784.1 hypothetical protein IV38_GL000989 [Lactobacillus selangorensis]KRN32806.1 hypothetical protein IV40_GL000864 [Lactobacillus selangorensis]
MSFFFQKAKKQLFAPVNGELIPLKDVPDDDFASGMLGAGFAIEPINDAVYSPVKGVVNSILPSKHAIGIKSGSLEVLVHMGIDTYTMEGVPFKLNVAVGDHVKPTTQLATMNRAEIRESGKPVTTMVSIMNSRDAVADFEVSPLNGIMAHGQPIAVAKEDQRALASVH